MGSTAALPDNIEIFRAGRRTADSGETYEITEADLVAAAAAYDPGLHEAPLVVGHPKSNHPAYGWVAGLTVGAGGVLMSSHRQVDPQFAEMVNAGHFKKRSTSFYHPTDPINPKPGIWYPRHVGFLGAQPPAVKGLKDIEFNESDEASAINFSEPINTQESDMSKELQDQLAAAELKLKAEKEAREKAERDLADESKKRTTAEGLVTSFSERAATERHAAHVSFAEEQVKAGKLLPKDQATFVAVLDTVAAVQPVEFSEGDAKKTVSPIEFLKTLVSGAAPLVDFSEQAPAHLTDGASKLAAKGDSDAVVDKKAKAYAAAHKVDYAEALRQVTVTFSN